jgi:hypothetical protein
VNKQSDEESGAEEDMVPVEIKPGHIRFQPRGKGFLKNSLCYIDLQTSGCVFRL